MEDGSGILNLKKMNEEGTAKVLLDLNHANSRLSRLSSVYISEEGIILGMARFEGEETAPVLFMFQPNSRHPSIFNIKDINNNKILLDRGFARIMNPAQ